MLVKFKVNNLIIFKKILLKLRNIIILVEMIKIYIVIQKNHRGANCERH